MPCRWCKDSGEECGCGFGHCIHCGGTGHVTPPPFGDGSKTQMSDENVAYLAGAATDLQCIGTSGMINGTAYRAAGIHLSPQDVLKFQCYWSDPRRDATLGEFIRQIAERAESYI